MLDTALAKKRLVGLLLAAVILALFLIFNRFPKLDTVQGDLEAVTSSTLECFQSFCIDRDPDSTFFSRWWEFSLTYLRLVSVGMVFAFVVAGLTEAFLFPAGGTGTSTGKSSFKRTLKGLAIGPVMNLCSACIVPISSTFRKTGVGIEGAISMVQGSATLNIPSLIMVAMVFTPLLGVSRLVMGVAAALLIGPLVVMVLTGGRNRALPDQEEHLPPEIAESARWGPAMREAFADWGRATVRFMVRLGPIMVLAGFASGLVMQWTSPDVVEKYLGNNVMGVAIAATFGLLINVPLLFEIPLVALLLLLGMGNAPAATLLFAAAAGGPITFWGLAKSMPKRAVVTFAAATWTVGILGGVAILGYSLALPNNGSGLRIEAASHGESLTAPRITRTDSPMRFTDVTIQSGIDYKHVPLDEKYDNVDNGWMAGGAVAEDFNGDGWVDLFVLAGNAPPALLYVNQKDGTFKDEAADRGAAISTESGMAAAAADYDNDGDIDIFVANDFPPHVLLTNEGDGHFSRNDTPLMQPAAFATSPSWGDINNDGLLELVLGEWNPIQGPIQDAIEAGFIDSDPQYPYWSLWMYLNLGDGYLEGYQFRSSSLVSRENFVFAPRFADLNGDFYADLAVVSDYGRSKLYLNNGRGKFDDATEIGNVGTDENGMGSAIGDFDNDGDLDWFISSIYDLSEVKEGPWGGSGNRLFRNRGDASFEDVTDLSGVRDGNWGWGSSFGDLDNDGDLDIYHVTGWVNAEKLSTITMWNNKPARLFENLGNSAFFDVASQVGADDLRQGRGVILFDFDNDGDLDIFITNNQEFAIQDGAAIRTPGSPVLLRNDTPLPNHWLKVTIEAEPPLHRDGLGCKVFVTAGQVTQMRELHASTNFVAQEPGRIAHFGLGASSEIDELRVECAGGVVQSQENIPADRHVNVNIEEAET